MANDTKAMRVWRVMTGGRLDLERVLEPLHWRTKRTVRLAHDVFDGSLDGSLDEGAIDTVFAVMASARGQDFLVETAHAAAAEKYLHGVTLRGPQAMADYIGRTREHWKTYGYEHNAPASQPAPPTAELRVLYDSATAYCGRPQQPCGHTLHCGFVGGEYQWQPWPLLGVHIRAAETGTWITVAPADAELGREYKALLAAVGEFRQEMELKALLLAAAGRRGWNDPARKADLQVMLQAAVDRLLAGESGQAADVALIAMFLGHFER